MIKERRAGLYSLLNVSGVTTLLGTPIGGNYPTNIFHEKAPDAAVPPWIIYDKQNGRPDLMAMKDAHTQNDIFMIKGVAKNDAPKAEQIADAIYAAVHDKPIVITGQNALWLRRETDLDYWEMVEGDRWDHVGWQFRLVTEGT